MRNIFSDNLLLFSFESLDKKIQYSKFNYDESKTELYKFKTFTKLRANNVCIHGIKPVMGGQIEIVKEKDYLLLRSLYFISFKSKICHNFKNKAINNYFKFFFFLSRKNFDIINGSNYLFEDDIYLETLAVNNLYSIYQLQMAN